VLGKPISHSLSPTLHRAAYRALGLAWSYEAIETDIADLPKVLADHPDWAGFSCTMPLKRAVLEVADEVGPLAAAVGAGNTLLPRVDGGWIAENTDVVGIVDTVQAAGLSPRSVTLLGAGGTAQAAVAALVRLGIDECWALVRDVSRTGELARTAQVLGVHLGVAELDLAAPQLGADLIVSTLPAHAADPFAAASWSPQQAVLDVVYVPWPTALAAAAERAGAAVLSGAEMLLYQAAAQVELMTGRAAPVAAMRDAMLRALRTSRES
jgi:shikimate dehydrogenase